VLDLRQCYIWLRFFCCYALLTVDRVCVTSVLSAIFGYVFFCCHALLTVDRVRVTSVLYLVTVDSGYLLVKIYSCFMSYVSESYVVTKTELKILFVEISCINAAFFIMPVRRNSNF
jgi:hypothetical protein